MAERFIITAKTPSLEDGKLAKRGLISRDDQYSLHFIQELDASDVSETLGIHENGLANLGVQSFSLIATPKP